MSWRHGQVVTYEVHPVRGYEAEVTYEGTAQVTQTYTAKIKFLTKKTIFMKFKAWTFLVCCDHATLPPSTPTPPTTPLQPTDPRSPSNRWVLNILLKFLSTTDLLKSNSLIVFSKGERKKRLTLKQRANRPAVAVDDSNRWHRKKFWLELLGVCHIMCFLANVSSSCVSFWNFILSVLSCGVLSSKPKLTMSHFTKDL